MIRIDVATTAEVVDWPTPTVPPSVFRPLWHATVPMMSAKAEVLTKPPRMSSVESPSQTAAMNELELIPKNCVETTQPPPMPTASATMVKSGSVMSSATSRGATSLRRSEEHTSELQSL